MKKAIRKIAAGSALASLAALSMMLVTDMPADAQTTTPDPQYTTEGSERCLFCHAAERMELMADTVHGDATNPHTPWAEQGCESCHGPGSLHVSRARGGIGQPPLLQFGEDHPLPEQTAACLTCHKDDMGDLEGFEWTGSMHDTDEVTCTSCHSVHQIGNPLTEREPQLENCTECHKDEIRDHNRFENAGIVFDRLMCVDCHDVHNLVHDL